jgi:hypothetical protein
VEKHLYTLCHLQQTDRRQNSSGIFKYFSLIILFAASFALYQVRTPFFYEAVENTQLAVAVVNSI